MPFTKTERISRTYQAPEDFVEVRTEVQPSNGSSQRVVKVEVRSSDELKKQLDPKSVTLQSLVDNNMTIDPGKFFNVLNETDPASLEEMSNPQLEKIYNFLVENKDRLFHHEQKEVKPDE